MLSCLTSDSLLVYCVHTPPTHPLDVYVLLRANIIDGEAVAHQTPDQLLAAAVQPAAADIPLTQR